MRVETGNDDNVIQVSVFLQIKLNYLNAPEML